MSNEVNQVTTDAVIAAAGSKATYTGAGFSAAGWLTSSEAGVVIGIVIGVIGLVVNLYFKRREDKRQQAEHEARMQSIARTVQAYRDEH